MPSRYAHLSREQLAIIVPELLLTGHLMDRAGSPYTMGEWGAEVMSEIAIEEWAAASPIYTRRMQRALRFTGDDVVTIFKGMQLEIGAPPQFMDFRYWVDPDDPYHGGFHLDHCGALLDVEPVGEGLVKLMCHDIEDPTFDATAVATNPKARVRPVHRPPRTPADRHPHCAWTVDIDAHSPDVEPIPALTVMAAKRVASLELDPIDEADEGVTDYRGDLVSDIDFAAFAHSALVRIADEVVIQHHLLSMSYMLAVAERAENEEQLRRITRNQLIGAAGLTATRLARALELGNTPEDAAYLLELHPVMNPSDYVDFQRDGDVITVSASPAHADGAWLWLIDPRHPQTLQAVVRALNPRLDVEIEGGATDWTARVVPTDTAAPDAEAVAIAKFSKGADFAFRPRRSLPLFVR
jgi:hypothetical protein